MCLCCAKKEIELTVGVLRLPRQAGALEGNKQYRKLVESLRNLHGLQNSKPTANPGRRSKVMEPAISLQGHECSNFHAAVEKLILMAWRADVQSAFQQLPTQVLNPTTESKRAVKQLLRYLKGTHNTCLRPIPHMPVQKGMIEHFGRSDSDWAGDSSTRLRVTCYHCSVQERTSLLSVSSSRDAVRFCTACTPKKRTRRTRAHRDSLQKPYKSGSEIGVYR